MSFKKKVNIHPQGRPITVLNNMIRSDVMGAYLTTEEIRNILIQKGAVREVMPDGSTVTLNLNNYNKTNLFDERRKEIASENEKARQDKIVQKKLENDIKTKDMARASAIAKVLTSTVPSEIKKDTSIDPPTVKDVQTNKGSAPLSSTPAGYTEKFNARKTRNKKSIQDAVESARAKIEANKKKNK